MKIVLLFKVQQVNNKYTFKLQIILEFYKLLQVQYI